MRANVQTFVQFAMRFFFSLMNITSMGREFLHQVCAQKESLFECQCILHLARSEVGYHMMFAKLLLLLFHFAERCVRNVIQ